MRKGLAIAALALAAGLGVHGADAHAAKKRSACDMPGTTTIKKQSGSRVFQKRGRSRVNGPLLVTYACRYKTGKVFKLGTEYLDDVTDGAMKLIRLAGPYVASARQVGDDFSDDVELRVMDLRTGKSLFPNATLADSEEVDVTDTALTANGSFAWIADVDIDDKDVTEVYVMVDGKYRKVDSATGINGIPPTSLLLEGNKLSWANNGEIKELMLP